MVTFLCFCSSGNSLRGLRIIITANDDDKEEGQPVVSICRCHKYPADFYHSLIFSSPRV